MNYNVDENGFYGQFGGAYIPEMLYPNIEQLTERYLNIMSESSFKIEFNQLLKNYVGRPTPLYYAKRFSKKYKTKVYFKREDLCHTANSTWPTALDEVITRGNVYTKNVISSKNVP